MAEHKNIVVSKKLVAINSASSVLAKALNVTVLLWMYQYLLHRITAEEFAILPIVTSLMVFAPLFFSFFTGGISRYVVEAYAKGDFARIPVLISSIFPPLVVVGAIFLLGGAAFALNIEKFLNIAPGMVSSAQSMLLLLVASFTLQMLALPFLSGFHVRQRFIELNLFGIARDLIRMGLLLFFLLYFGPQVIWVVIATVISDTIYSIVLVIRARFLVPELRLQRGKFRWSQAKELTSFGLWTTIGRLGGIMYTNAATILLNIYGTAVDVTCYHIGATFYRQIDSTVGLAAQTLQPALTAMYALDDKRRLAETVLRGGRYASWITLLVATPLVIYSDSFVHLYLGEEYSQASMVIILFMIIYPFTSPMALLPLTAIATKQVKAFFSAAFIFQFFGLILMISFLSFTELGAVGATLSLTIITILAQILFFWILCLKIIERSFADLFRRVLVPGYSPAIAASIVWIALDLNKQPESWHMLIAYSVYGALVYVAVLFGFCLNKGERADLKKILVRS
ncbi:oligosaccharide flippase family protein [Ruegeria sp. Alg231-54]|uniref:oligosaccharide flippase family protein n=1 Tax=Ruegeria sp. Alg231-54 TaxID=1922221 RepID=UPI000D557571|nr:oligosaccharide flippase family protein [Ruegeria sp. Alg231-54]